MQTITISITVPDGVQFTVNATPGEVTRSEPVPTGEPKPAGPKIEDLKRAFLEAVRRDKSGAFAALGVATLADVAEATYATIIDKLNAVPKADAA